MPKKLNSKNYTKSQNQKEFNFYKFIIDGKSSIKQAADLVGINSSSARMILKNIYKPGIFFNLKRCLKQEKIYK